MNKHRQMGGRTKEKKKRRALQQQKSLFWLFVMYTCMDYIVHIYIWNTDASQHSANSESNRQRLRARTQQSCGERICATLAGGCYAMEFSAPL